MRKKTDRKMQLELPQLPNGADMQILFPHREVPRSTSWTSGTETLAAKGSSCPQLTWRLDGLLEN